MTYIPAHRPIRVHRYGRCQLYDTIAQEDVSETVLQVWDAIGISFVVIDVETGEDVTESFLLDSAMALTR